MEEPSVLDYVKSRLMPWKYPRIEIPAPEAPQRARSLGGARPTLAQAENAAAGQIITAPQGQMVMQDLAVLESQAILDDQAMFAGDTTLEARAARPAAALQAAHWPWRSLVALFLALAAQYSLGPSSQREWSTGVFLLVLSLAFLGWAGFRREWPIAPPPNLSAAFDPPTLRPGGLLVGLVLSIIAFFIFGDLHFNAINTLVLLVGLFFVLRAFWVASAPWRTLRVFETLRVWWLSWGITIRLKTLVGLAAIALVIFFRFYRLGDVPPEMNSDHAEKILDILRVLQGDYLIFFPSNGGREALIFYLGAAVHRYLGLPLGFDALKWVSICIAALSLPFLYLLGVEMGSRRVGWLAFVLAGVAYWPNVVARFGLRLPFYMLFTASTLYFLLHGLRTGKRNHFIYAGISLGLSFYGYSADRILPVLVLTAIGLYLIHRQASGRRLSVLVSTLALVLASFVLFLPLLRYILSEPDAFLFRTLTRMGGLERPLEASPSLIFLNNVWRALAMFSWDNGEIWPTSIPHYPALGVVSGALFYMGAGLLVIRYLRRRHWQDLFWLLSVPILQLPSTLSLAFPAENPNLYRTGGALIPVFLMAAMALDGLMRSLTKRIPAPWGGRYAWAVALVMVGLACMQDYDLVFRQFYEQYRLSSWNTSEIGQVVGEYTRTIGAPDTAWLMGAPHWVDSRLVAINAGYPGKDFALFADELGLTAGELRAKLFIVKPDDQATIDALEQFYPQGWFQTYPSKAPTKDFLIYFVPPTD